MEERGTQQIQTSLVVPFVLLLSLWVVWLVFQAGLVLLAEIAAVHSRSVLRRGFSWGLIALVLLLAPPGVGLWWARMRLLDAAEIAALQADGQDPAWIEVRLRRRAFRLGFHDILSQPDAIRIHREDREGGPVCRVVLDFQHRPGLYGWNGPQVRIAATVQAFMLPQREGGWPAEWLDGP